MFQHKANGFKQVGRSLVKQSSQAGSGYRSRLQTEELEPRVLLSVVRAGSEFRVNPFTTSQQESPKVAADAAGDFIAVWDSQDGSGYGIYAQSYNSAGVAQGSEFKVNTYTTGNQLFASVAMDAGGDFVVAWASYGQDGNGWGVYAQRYNASGAIQGGEFQVNTFITGGQAFPSVAMDNLGDFVVAWQSYGQDGSGYGVYAQRYNSTGAVQGGEFQVNTYTTNDQRSPAVAMNAEGDFVVTWESPQDGGAYGIYAQRYNAAGAVQGSEFRANTYTTSDQITPAVAMDSSGDFVVTWQSYGQDGAGYGIYAQRYHASGVAQGGEFQVNTYTTSSQAFSSVAMDSSGDFVVDWQSNGQDGSGYGVYAQCYSASGTVQGGEFQVNTYTTNDQKFSSVAMDAAGDFVVAWESPQDGGAYGIYAQRYVVAPSSVVSRDLFYAGSTRFDRPGGTNPQTPSAFSDDNAIATDKTAYLPNTASNATAAPATMANVSAYDQGINGIMVDLLGGGNHSSISASDFTIKVGNNNSPSTWATGLSPTVSVRPGAGAAGSDRVELTWAGGSITEKWVEVTVLADANTGLAANDVFFFGSEIADTGSSNTATIAKVSSSDVTGAQIHGATLKANIPVTNIYDFNKDGTVTAADVTDAQTHGTTTKTGLVFLQLGTGGPFAPLPPGDGASGTVTTITDNSAIASGLTTSSASLPPSIPAWIANRLSSLDLNSGPIAKYFEHLAHEDTAKSRTILVKADQAADTLGLDDESLDSLLGKLGLE